MDILVYYHKKHKSYHKLVWEDVVKSLTVGVDEKNRSMNNGDVTVGDFFVIHHIPPLSLCEWGRLWWWPLPVETFMAWPGYLKVYRFFSTLLWMNPVGWDPWDVQDIQRDDCTQHGQASEEERSVRCLNQRSSTEERSWRPKLPQNKLASRWRA